jgi:hypothetical protein
MILALFHRAFKARHRVSVSEGELRESLQAFLDDLREGEPDFFGQSPTQHLDDWCSDKHPDAKPKHKVSPCWRTAPAMEVSLEWVA